MTLEQVVVTSEQNQNTIDYARAQAEKNAVIDFKDIFPLLDHNSLTLHDKRQLSDIYGIEVREITSMSKSYLKNQQVRTSLGTVPKDEYEFVDLMLEKWGTRMSFQGIFTIKTPYEVDGLVVSDEVFESLSREDQIKVKYNDPKELTLKDIEEEITFQNRKLNLMFNKEQIGNAIGRWVNKKKNDLSSDIMVKVSYRGAAEEEWDRFVAAITQVRLAETKTVLKHFIWQVKRKMFGLPVTYHMMPIFFGPQGAGKSIVVNKYLCGPVSDFFASTDFKDITDSRNHDIWRNYVLFFDEMGHSITSNLEDIKRKITEDKFNSRILTKNNDTVVINRATFIGTTNKDISSLIFDDTGMRRFYQIDCLRRLDWSVTQTLDYLKLWRSVDETQDTPLALDTKVWDSIRQAQASKRQITMIERWLRERPHQPFVEERIMAKAFFDEFVKFEQAHTGSGRSDMNSNKFARALPNIIMNIPELEIIKDKKSLGIEYRVTYHGDIRKDEAM